MDAAAANYPPLLAELVATCDGLDRQGRIELLSDYARRLPPVPEAIRARRELAHWVTECRAQVTFYLTRDGDQVQLWIEMVEMAPVVAAVAAILIEGCTGATPAQIAAIPTDLPVRIIGPEMVGQRRYGLRIATG